MFLPFSINTQRVLILLAVLILFLPVRGPAQERELVDVASFFNGAFPYRVGNHSGKIVGQLATISGQRVHNPFPAPGKSTEESKKVPLYLYYALAAPARIASFRLAAAPDTRNMHVPRRIEFAVSQTPDGDFQTVAAFDLPESQHTRPQRDFETQYDYTVPARREVSARYVRIALSGSQYGHYRFSRFSAYGRFEQPVPLREGMGGYYNIVGSEIRSKLGSAPNRSSSIFLKQEKGLLQGCYVLGHPRDTTQVVGTLIGGVENNVARLAYTNTESGEQSTLYLGLAYREMSRRDGLYSNAYLVFEDARGNMTAQWSLRFSETDAPCAVSAQKTLRASLEKTGKAQLYGVNFDFDSDVLRPESGAVLDEVAKLAQANPGWKFEVGGHTDSIGSADYNLKLSERRAASVARYLSGKGVAAARLKARGYGSTRPLAAGNDDAAHARNRRVELVKQ